MLQSETLNFITFYLQYFILAIQSPSPQKGKIFAKYSIQQKSTEYNNYVETETVFENEQTHWFHSKKTEILQNLQPDQTEILSIFTQFLYQENKHFSFINGEYL